MLYASHGCCELLLSADASSASSAGKQASDIACSASVTGDALCLEHCWDATILATPIALRHCMLYEQLI